MAVDRSKWVGADAVLMSDEDFAKIQSNSDAWNAAKERGDQGAMDALHADSERIRAKYNYSGGAAGTEYNRLPENQNQSYTYASSDSRTARTGAQQAASQQKYTPQYSEQMQALTQTSSPDYTPQYEAQLLSLMGQSAPTYSSRYAGQIEALSNRQAPTYTPQYEAEMAALREQAAPEYQSRYADELEQRTRSLLDRAPFSYDPYTDPVYSAYAKQYTREGRRAAADTLGQYAAMTGGLPSTAAVTASQQAGNYYGAKLADVIPQLYQQAYARYQDEGNQQTRNINALRQLENDEYSRYVNALNQRNTDRNFNYALLSQLENNAYNRYVNDLNQYNADRSFDYGVLNQLEANDRSDYQTRLAQWNADRSFDAGLLSQAEANAYNRYLNQLSQYNTDRSFNAGILSQLESDAYNRYRDEVSDARYADALEYERSRDAQSDARYEDETAYARALAADQLAYDRWRDVVGDARYEDETGYNRAQYADETAYNRALTDAQLRASYGDYSGLQALGITPDMNAVMQRTLAENGRAAPIGSGGTGGSGSGGGGGNGSMTPVANDTPVQTEQNYIQALRDTGGNIPDSLLKDLVDLRGQGADPDAINNVITVAATQGLITQQQARELRGAYVGVKTR